MIAPQVAIDNDVATLMFHPDTRIVHHQWHKFVYGEQFRQVMMTGAELMQKNKGCKWLSDDRGNGALPAADEQWGSEVWVPAVLAAGWKHWALVMPTKAIGQLNMKKLMAQFSSLGVSARVFDDPDEAYAWLARQ